ncbi:MAG TPA: sigma-54-dependent Fis family transcriptional regulator [Mesotoga infera]|jgi:PAS domain S-box-containing protein|nr:sigma-54-dependent Fis family transcriptional regulator [Mesotoga infera]HON28607.1 sigma-54-dependent Fis family transcriptional regulator [Mesotoga infera]HPD38172.1 sigma-54-dependent Fis family transcriptional regulator [Mesotoga infera]HRR44306.1 sigma-54-dependent Fis family transcriptional regulator [Mesotoga sp.]HRV01688.1 sigma-54-dependent Fis family transcriptional regulator [Mesotoga sp.]
MGRKTGAIVNRDLFDRILNFLMEGIIVIDATGKIIFINEEALKIVGLTRDRAENRLIVDTIPNTRLHIVLQSGTPEINRIQYLGDKTIVTSRFPLMDESGKVYAAMAIFRDMTNVEKMAEEVINHKEMESLLTGIIDATYDAISVADEKGKIVLVNKAYTRITGMSAEYVIGKMATVDIAEGSSLHMEVARIREPVFNAKLKVGPGKKDVIVNVTPLLVKGKFKGSVGVIHDISEIERLARELEDARRLLRYVKAKYTFDDIAGSSPLMKIAKEQARKVSRTRATVLLNGQSGTGKELFAHAIHNSSDRRDANFISVNCAALPETLLESELFGYVEGAFTGAIRGGKKGLLQEANGGTVFLDEVGKMNLSVQSKFLRFLQDHEIKPVGGNKSVKLDVRIIAATNLELDKLVEEGRFLSDLYYRLNVVPIVIPALKNHPEDIPEIVHTIIMRLNQEYGRMVERIEPAALNLLQKHDWPGNVRELENVIGRAIINMEPDEHIIKTSHLQGLSVVSERRDLLPEGDLEKMMSDYEKRVIVAALDKNDWNKTATAKELGISIRNLYYKIERYGIRDNKGSG